MTNDDPGTADRVNPSHLERYSRQIRFPGIGRDGQERIRAARVLLCGCGALGTVLADTLVRAGVGFLRNRVMLAMEWGGGVVENGEIPKKFEKTSLATTN